MIDPTKKYSKYLFEDDGLQVQGIARALQTVNT